MKETGADHDAHLRLAARASAPGSGRRSFCSDGGPYIFLHKRYSRMEAKSNAIICASVGKQMKYSTLLHLYLSFAVVHVAYPQVEPRGSRSSVDPPPLFFLFALLQALFFFLLRKRGSARLVPFARRSVCICFCV